MTGIDAVGFLFQIIRYLLRNRCIQSYTSFEYILLDELGN